MWLLFLTACTGTEKDRDSESDSDTDTDTDSDTDSDTDTDTDTDTDSDTDSDTDTGPLALGEPCDPLHDTCVAGAACCTACCEAGAEPVCTTTVADACPLPDLTVDAYSAALGFRVETQSFDLKSCAVIEGCVGGIGERRLLRFTTTVPNLGPASLTLGAPYANPDEFAYSDCHAHYHYQDFMENTLLGPDGALVVGQKQAFCLMDTEPWDAAEPGPNYHCGWQGITAGWADTYPADYDCQWLDVTDIPPGDYVLRLEVDPLDKFPEATSTNNVVEIDVAL